MTPPMPDKRACSAIDVSSVTISMQLWVVTCMWQLINVMDANINSRTCSFSSWHHLLTHSAVILQRASRTLAALRLTGHLCHLGAKSQNILSCSIYLCGEVSHFVFFHRFFFVFSHFHYGMCTMHSVLYCWGIHSSNAWPRA